jgi:hypothetical protein
MFIQEERICPTNTGLLRYAQHHLSETDMNQMRSQVEQCPTYTQALESHDVAGSAQPPTVGSANHVPPEDLKGLFTSRSAHFRQLLQRIQPEWGRFGQIWTTKPWKTDQRGSTEGDILLRIIVLLEDEADTAGPDERSLVAAPISLDLAYQSNYDLMVFEQESPLGYPFMIEAWNPVSPLRSQLERCLGVLQQPLKRFLGLVYQAYLGMPVDVSEAVQHLGPAILHPHDPRLSFQEQEIEACEYLRHSLLELLRKEDQANSQSKPRERVIVSLSDVLVKYGRFPYERSRSGKIRPQAAATQEQEEESPSYFIQASYPGGEIIGKLIRDYVANTLSLHWEGIAPELEGKLVRIEAHTKAGRSFAAGEQLIQPGTPVLLVSGAKVPLSQVERLSLEIIDKVERDGTR